MRRQPQQSPAWSLQIVPGTFEPETSKQRERVDRFEGKSRDHNFIYRRLKARPGFCLAAPVFVSAL